MPPLNMASNVAIAPIDPLDSSNSSTKIAFGDVLPPQRKLVLEKTDSSSTLSLEQDTTSAEEKEDAARDLASEDPVPELAKETKTPTATTTRTRRPSILKTNEDELIPIAPKASWLNLPKPELSKLPRCTSAPACMETNNSTKTAALTKTKEPQARRRQTSVGFATISVREYDQTLGDNPSVSYGPPISLDWNYQENEPLELDEYETNRKPRRSLRQMCMNYYMRRNTLMHFYEVPEKELEQATRKVEKAKRGRAVTKYFLPLQKVEDMVTSAGRKAKRGFKKGNKEKR